MEQTRSWFTRFQPRGDRLRGALSKKGGSTGSDSGKETQKSSRGVPVAAADELPSSITRQKVAAAKQYIENHYKAQMKNLQERKERYRLVHSCYSLFAIRSFEKTKTDIFGETHNHYSRGFQHLIYSTA